MSARVDVVDQVDDVDLTPALIVTLTPVQEAILVLLRQGNTRGAAFGAVGVPKTSFYRWMRENGTFRHSVEIAESESEVSHVGAIFAAATGGQLKKRTAKQFPDGRVFITEEYTSPDWRACAYWLGVRRRAWRAERLDLGSLSNEQIISLLEEEVASRGVEEADFEAVEDGGTDAIDGSDGSGSTPELS